MNTAAFTMTYSSPDRNGDIAPFVPREKASLSPSPGRCSPCRAHGSIAPQSSPPPPPRPPGQQPRRSVNAVGVYSLLEPEMLMDLYSGSFIGTNEGQQQPKHIVTPPVSSRMIIPYIAPASIEQPLETNCANVVTPATPAHMGLAEVMISSPLEPFSSNREHHSPSPGPSPLQQLPILRSCTFYALRIIYFPKTIFLKSVAFGRGYASRIGLASSSPYRGKKRQQHDHTRNSSSSLCDHQRHRRDLEVAENHGDNHGNTRSRSEPDGLPNMSSRRRQGNPPESRSRSRSRSHSSSRLQSLLTWKKKKKKKQKKTSGLKQTEESTSWRVFLNSYHVQVGTICLCMAGESIAQSVICPFLYYMVRDFHVGADIWIGYYAGLLLTGYWGANLCTTLFWGHLSDKYGRKAVLLFGLIMTSLSTIYLGLATCYHDAMWALVFQGACTGIVPVSKCAIGEIANRQQKICDAQLAALPKHRHNCHHQHQQQQQEQEHELEQCSTRPSGYETRRHHPRHYAMNEMTGEIMEDKQARRFDSSPCSHPECQNDFEQIENSHQEKKHLQPREDYCAKGYSGLVIAVAAGAALGPLIGGSLARKQIPGFENHIYLAPCLVAACIVLCLTGLVALVLNETNPKWATPLALPPVYVEEARRVNVVHEHTVDHNLPASISSLTRTRGRPGYEQSQRFLREEGVHNNNNSVCISGSNDDSNVGSSLDTTCFEEVDKVDDHGGGVGSSGAGGRIAQRTTTRSKTTAAASDSLKCSSPLQLQHSHLQEQYPLPSPYRQRHNHVQPVQPLCSCLPVVSSLSPNSGITFKRTKSSPSTTSKKNTLSPATHLFLVLGIYSLLVLISILGSEFVMLYTQSPISRGGLEFSAKVLGQVLTMRGILKLTFNLLGYPWMVRRLGLVHCLRLGIAIIGVVSIFGMGSFVPWSIEQERSLMMMTMESSNSHEPTSIGVGPSDNDNSRGYRDHDPANNNQSPIGMSVVLLCMSMISMGDVLGYISVLVLFGKSADRLKGANKKDATEDGATTSNPNQQQTQSGSGILWSVAQVSANIMRLAGPVIAGLLWSLTDKGHPGAKSDETVGPFSAHRMSPESSAAIMHGTQTTFSLPGTTIDDSDDKDISSTKVSSLTSLFIYVFSGPTSVFYLVGAICVLNFIACQYLLPSESSSTSSFDSHGPPFENVQEQQYLEQQQERCDESLNTVGDYTFGDKEEKWEESKEGNNNVDPEKVLSSGTGVRHVATAGSTM